VKVPAFFDWWNQRLASGSKYPIGSLSPASEAWNYRGCLVDAREAELRAEIAAKDAEIERLRIELSESQRWVAKYEAEQSANSMMVLIEHDEHDRLLALDEENKRLQRRVEDLLKERIDAMLGDDDKPQNDY